MEHDENFFYISDEERERYIERLVKELPVLRIKLGLSQDEMGNLLGVSRQTYSSIETKKRKMSWSIYLSLVFIFDGNFLTHDIIREMDIFPKCVFPNNPVINDNKPISSFIKIENESIKNHLDDRAIHAIETVVMMEYARCNNISGESVIKAFDGQKMTKPTEEDKRIHRALSNIRAGTVKK